MRDIGGVPVITLCCAPDWMTSLGTETSSKYPNLPPTAAHYADFADLARRIAERYPDVQHYVVWNEMKGLWNKGAGQWDYVAYTAMYNAVYDALKGVNPEHSGWRPLPRNRGDGHRLRRVVYRCADCAAQRFGPRLLARSRTWGGLCRARPQRAGLPRPAGEYSEAEKLDLAYTFSDIVEQMRARTSLPVWYIEQHFAGKAGGPLDFQAVGAASMLRHQLLGGTAVTFQWEPEQNGTQDPTRVEENLFSSARQTNGAQPYPTYYVYRLFPRPLRPRHAPLRARHRPRPISKCLPRTRSRCC